MTATLTRGLSPVRTELANGAVVIVQDTLMTPAVTISAAFRAGSMFDPAELPGLSYMTGRVIDRGTELRSASQIAEDLDNCGVSLKVSVSRQSLTLSCTCLSEDFEYVLGIVADVLRRPTFAEPEMEKRRAEVVTALRQNEDNPGLRALDAVMEMLYTRDHPYGRPPKGDLGGVERISRADLVAFHRRRIKPSALSMVIVGNVIPSDALDRAAAELEDWIGEPTDRVDVPPVSRRSGHRRHVIAMPGKPQTDIVYGFTTIRRRDPRYHAYWMMNNILGQFGLGGRLAENIRERHGMAYYAFSTLDPAAGEAPLLIRAGVDPANVDRALAAITHEVTTLGLEGPTVKEVEETRAYLIGSVPRLLETNQSIAAFLHTSEEYGLGLDFDRRLPDLIRAVTIEEIRAAAADTLNPDHAAVAVAGPSGTVSAAAASSSAAAATPTCDVQRATPTCDVQRATC